MAQTLHVDHVGLCGYDLASLQRAFAEIGLTTEYGGAHATGGTHNALLGFDDGSYLELIAPQHPESMSPADLKQWSALKPDAAHACFWAIGSSDIHRDVEKLRHAGLKIGDPKPGTRKKPDGTLLQWETAAIQGGPEAEILPFLIQDRTPRSARIQPSASVKGTKLTGIELILFVVRDLDAAAALYRRTFDLPAPSLSDDPELHARLAYFPGTPVLLAQPAGDNSPLMADMQKFGEGPAGFLLGTKDFAATAKQFQLVKSSSWFGRQVAWFDSAKLHGARMGVIAGQSSH